MAASNPVDPVPANQATGVKPGSSLCWEAVTPTPDYYEIYVTDNLLFQGVQIIQTTEPCCTPALEYDTTYYWFVRGYYDESMVASDLWSFTTGSGGLRETPTGDLDSNFRVNASDLEQFSQQWLGHDDCTGDDCADFDGDGSVNGTDFALLAQGWGQTLPSIVINEIHYHTDNNTEAVEFVELYNASIEAVDLSGWSLDEAIDYRFPAGTSISGKGYVVVGQDPAAIMDKFGVTALGPFEGKLSNDGEELVLLDDAGQTIDQVDYNNEFPWPIAADGEGASMELIHPGLDNDLAGSWRSSGYVEALRPQGSFGDPTPGAKNGAWNSSAPPQIRQVNNEPENPVSGEDVVVTAKVTDSDGVNQVLLKVQVVLPGDYIPAYLPIDISSLKTNPYQSQPLNLDFEDEANWTTVTMTDDGLGQDEVAGDDIYTAVLPGQVNRTLMRYRIVAQDNTSATLQVPYADDPSLNFAYYVYDGVPDYVATEDSVTAEGPGYAHSAEVLTSVPVYTLVTRADDFYQCNGYRAADRIDQGSTSAVIQDAGRAYNWEGAFVYDGKVYDHIGYRLRGGNGRYNYSSYAGKRAMKFRFNRGHYFQARDIYGDKFPAKWQHLNTGKMFGNRISSGYNRYPYGLNEVMDMRLFQAFDVPAPDMWWFHFRVVDGQDEAPTGTDGQYLGDFWGLHLAFENYDGAFLERLGLPKGNLYKLSDKIYDGERQLRYQGPEAVTDSGDYENIRWNLNHEASVDFIRDYLDCDEWYRYHTVTEAIRHYDIFSGSGDCIHDLKNCAWYFYPDYSTNGYGKLQFLPFDVDDTWGPYFNYGIDHAMAAIYDVSYLDHVFTQYTIDPEKSPLKQEYRNRIREFRDLQWQPEVINGMIDELAAHIEDLVPADRDRWRLDRTNGTTLDNGPLDECVELMKQFAWDSGYFQGGYYWEGTSNHLDDLAGEDYDDYYIPDMPSIVYAGLEGYPINDLWFQSSAYSDSQGASSFAAISWRIAEFDLNTTGSDVDEPVDEIVLLDEAQTDWRYFKGTSSPGTTWSEASFNDSSWLSGQTPIGFSDNDDNTTLSDMRNNYTSVYVRNSFEIEDIDLIDTLILNVYVDDGCIIWINGEEVTRQYCSSEQKYYNSLTGASDHEASSYEAVPLTGPFGYLRNGTNVIAVHALQTTTGSSDFSIDVSVTMTEVAEVDPGADPNSSAPTGLAPSQYELMPLWQDDELTDPVEDRLIQIPAEGLEVGHTYRVRCRMQDNTGRWSHWSDPIEFVAGEPMGSELSNYLRISELMYNPVDDASGTYNNDDFEYLELINTSTSQTLDLSTVSLIDGVDFDFASGQITELSPGDTVLVVSHEEAFRARYGNDAATHIAGVYSGALSNGGERVELHDTWNGTLVAFTYDDNGDWPQSADGAGDALVPLTDLTLAELQAGALDDPNHWFAAAPTPGN